MSAVTIPEWVVTLVGRLTIENEHLRRAVEEITPPPEQSAPDTPDA